MNCGGVGATDHCILRSCGFPLADPNQWGYRPSSFEFKNQVHAVSSRKAHYVIRAYLRNSIHHKFTNLSPPRQYGRAIKVHPKPAVFCIS